MSDFENRLRKNAKHRFKWAARQGLTAFRLYDLDVPEWPFAVDWYAGYAHVMEYPRRRQRREGTLEAAREEVLRAVTAVLALPPERIFTKTHEPKPWGRAQYGRVGEASTTVLVEERGLRFECNLSDYLDTGLFLDHRETRKRVRGEAQGTRFLNLFAYTGSFSVYARAGGAAETTTVDLSNTYADWAERNLALNGFDVGPKHRVVRADVLAWLDSANGPFDLVVLDPPSFSSSKKMGRRFEVQRDHRHLVSRVLALLAPGGTLYFSTNFLGFELDGRLTPEEELTPRSIPEDFRRTVHRCWRFVRPPA
ncbi:MAG: class I SAM-dependent methyltransferase [Myxococcota bacterium]|jgi:23S rRNA (cytosine1962-C5)-methyltransferase